MRRIPVKVDMYRTNIDECILATLSSQDESMCDLSCCLNGDDVIGDSMEGIVRNAVNRCESYFRRLSSCVRCHKQNRRVSCSQPMLQ